MSSDSLVRYCRCGARLARDHSDALCGLCRKKARDETRCPPQVPPELWETDQMRDALAGWHMGRVIHAYRHHRFHGPRPLSQELVGRWLGLTQAQLSRIETGPPTRDLDKLVYWARTLRIPPQHLWFDLPGRRRAGDQAPAPVGFSSPACDKTAQGASADVAAMNAFRVADRQVGGGHLYATVASYLHTRVGPRLFGNGGDTPGQSVFRAAAMLTDMVGWMAHDAGRDAVAERHFVRASDLASLSGDEQLTAQILASMSHLAQHLHKPAEAVELARAGQAKARCGPHNPQLDARLEAMTARGLAGMHESTECTRTLIRSEEALARTPSGEPSEWTVHFDEAHLGIEAAWCLRQLGQTAEARRHAERAVAVRANDRTRTWAFGQLILAAVLAEQGDLDEACAVGYTVTEGTQALGSFRVVQQLLELRQLLEPHRSAKVVAQFLAQLAEALRGRQWLYRWLGIESGGLRSNVQP